MNQTNSAELVCADAVLPLTGADGKSAIRERPIVKITAKMATVVTLVGLKRGLLSNLLSMAFLLVVFGKVLRSV